MRKLKCKLLLFLFLGGINMKNKALKSAAVLGTVAVASFILAACGSKASSTKSSESGDKTLLFMLKSSTRLTWRKLSAALKKKLVLKLLLKLVTNGWIGQPFTRQPVW